MKFSLPNETTKNLAGLLGRDRAQFGGLGASYVAVS
jgi:hypothetical protein